MLSLPSLVCMCVLVLMHLLYLSACVQFSSQLSLPIYKLYIVCMCACLSHLLQCWHICVFDSLYRAEIYWSPESTKNRQATSFCVSSSPAGDRKICRTLKINHVTQVQIPKLHVTNIFDRTI